MTWLSHLVGPLVIVVVSIFLLYRLRGGYDEAVAGRGWQIAGVTMISLAALWRMVSALEGYTDWFVADAYAVFNIAQWLLLLGGLLFLTIGLSLRLDQWRQRSDDAESLQHRLSLMWDLQRQSRQPYQLMALLEMVIEAVTERLPETAGAVFLVNQNKRNIVLAATSGLSKEDTAGLERLKYRDNPVSETLQMGEPGIFGPFRFSDGEGRTMSLNYRSSLVLPLISGLEGVGGIVLMSDRSDHFGQADIRLLQPVAGWLAERVRATRLARELNTTRQLRQRLSERQDELTARLQRITNTFRDLSSLDALCRGLVGLYDSESVHLVSLASGQLSFGAGSADIGDLSQNYRTALIEALDRNRPLIINQETGRDGGRQVTVSTLVNPLPSPHSQTALVLRRTGEGFDISHEDLQVVSVFAGLASIGLMQVETSGLDLSRRAGFRKILNMLRFDRETPDELGSDFLADEMAQVLPRGSTIVAFDRQQDGSFMAGCCRGCSDNLLADFRIYPGEGGIGQSVADRQPRSYFGRAQVDRALEHYEAANREAFFRVFGEQGPPGLMVVAPVVVMDQAKTVLAVFIPDSARRHQEEWERLVTLATGLFGFRQTIAQLQRSLQPVHKGRSGESTIGSFVNQLNNHLSAIIGNAELARSRPELSGELNRHLQTIIDEAGRAEDYIRKAPLAEMPESRSGEAATADVNEAVESFVVPKRISDNLFMIGEHAREIDLRLRPVGPARIDRAYLDRLLEGILGRLSATMVEEQRLTISTYRWGEYVYLDISRHGPDEPASERLADLVEYRRISDEHSFIGDAGLGLAADDRRVDISADENSEPPRYLSFRFPRVRVEETPSGAGDTGTRLLVIDDQAMILDLITAMGQSLGYDVTATRSAEDGQKMALDKDFDIVLVDLAMPGRSGLDLAGKLHRQKPRLPIVLMTGWEVSVSRELRRQSGIREVLHKPFRIEQLTAVLRSAGRNLAVS